jgi:hypothetical protein
MCLISITDVLGVSRLTTQTVFSNQGEAFSSQISQPSDTKLRFLI